MSALEGRTAEAEALPAPSPAAQAASEEKKGADHLDEPSSPDDGGVAVTRGPATWAGVPKGGLYRELSKLSTFRRCQGGRRRWGEMGRTRTTKPGGGLKNVYFYVSLTKGKQPWYIGPGDELVLKTGVKVLYLATATKEGVAPSLIVCSMDRTGTRQVDVADIISLVRPSGPVDTNWVRDVLQSYVRSLREAVAQGLVA